MNGRFKCRRTRIRLGLGILLANQSHRAAKTSNRTILLPSRLTL